MADVIKINDNLSFTIDDDFFLTIKKNGLAISITPEEMELIQQKFKAFSTKLEGEIIDAINGIRGKEL